MRELRWPLLLMSFFVLLTPAQASTPKKRVLLLWHSPDGHPKDTHEYQLGQKILKATLEKHAPVEATLVCADEPWNDGPELLAKADGVVLFVSEGAKWINANPRRLAAFQACAKRKAGLAVLHWGMGTKDAKNISPFVDLFGGCHGGPDRKYKVVAADAKIADNKHPILRGMGDFKARDEFYYTLKFAKTKTPLLNVTIDGEAIPSPGPSSAMAAAGPSASAACTFTKTGKRRSIAASSLRG